MYESNLRHPVWVPDINVNPCNSVYPPAAARCFYPTIAQVLATIADAQLNFSCQIAKSITPNG